MTEVDQQALQIVQAFTNAVHIGESVSTPGVGEEEGTLNLIDQDNNTVEFTLTDGAISVDRGAGAVNLNNDRVEASGLLFRNLSRAGTLDIIQINFTLTYKNYNDIQTYNYSKSYVAAAHIYK